MVRCRPPSYRAVRPECETARLFVAQILGRHQTRQLLYGDNETDMLDVAAASADASADVFAPLPPGFIGGPTNRHPAEVDKLKTPL